MIQQIKKEMTHTVTSSVTVKEVYRCDVCERIFASSYTKEYKKENNLNVKMKPVNYFKIRTFHHEWGNDSGKSYESFEVCSEECLKKKFDEYLKIIKEFKTQELEIEPEYTETIVEEGEK